jgi:chromosomal replication initiation ATPase DnaA
MTDKEKLQRIAQLTITISTATRELSVLTGLTDSSPLDTRPEYIISVVTGVFGENILQKGANDKLLRKHTTTVARHTARYLMKKYTRLADKDISKATGGVEHSVIRYSVSEVRKYIDTDEQFREKLLECIEKIELIR